LIDAPICGAEPRVKGEFFEKAHSAAREGDLVVIYASNDFAEMFRCEGAAVLEAGLLRQTGTPQELYENPATRAVAAFTGRINLLEVRRLNSSKADIHEFQTIAGGHRIFAGKIERAALGPLNLNTYLAIRPEHLSISFGASFPEDNLLKASITGVRFLGPHTLVSLNCDGLPLEAYVRRLVGIGVGDECMVGLPPDRLRVLSQ
jgi:ABC-type sugar transport system ATPase subunit